MFIGTLGTLGIYLARGSGAPRRTLLQCCFARPVLFFWGCINALTFKYPIGLFYSKYCMSRFLAAFFVLALLFAATIVL